LDVEELDKELQQQQEVAKPDGNPILDTWIEQNSWYTKDEELGLEADVIAHQLGNTGRFTNDETGYKKLLNEVEKRIKKAFPEKFSNPKKDELPEVEGGRPSPTKKSKKTYEDLPQEARQACDEFVVQGLMTKDQYVSMYEWE